MVFPDDSRQFWSRHHKLYTFYLKNEDYKRFNTKTLLLHCQNSGRRHFCLCNQRARLLAYILFASIYQRVSVNNLEIW